MGFDPYDRALKIRESFWEFIPSWEFNWECEGWFLHTLCILGSMWSNSWVSFLAHHLPTPYLGREPKARVATPNAPCMEDGKCKNQYSRKFQYEMVTDVNWYPIYRHRDMGRTILVHDIELDNHWVVSHNVYLSTKYDAHINVEACNNIRANQIYIQVRLQKTWSCNCWILMPERQCHQRECGRSLWN